MHTPYRKVAWACSLAFTLTLLSSLSAHADLSGLIGYWPFEEGSGTIAADVTNTNNGTLVGGVAWIASPLGTYGLSFDGGNDYVNVGDPDSGVLDFSETQSFSFGAWIKPSIINNTGRRFISKVGADNIGFDIGVWSGCQGVFVDLSDGTMELSTDSIAIPVPVNEWSFVMAVVNRADSTLHVYANAVEAATTWDIYGLLSLSNATPLNFGRASGNSAKSFAGVIDGVRFYNRALSGADVQELLASMQTSLSFLIQPTNQTVEWSKPVTFNATFNGTPPYFYQWYSNSVAIPEATNSSYTIASATLGMNGSSYSIWISNTLPSSITSTGATLTVLQDITRPTLSGAVSRYPNEVVATFSEPVSASSAETTSNYTITNGAGQTVAITAAVLKPDGRAVALTPSLPLAEGADYVLVVSGVQDVASPPNTILPGSTGVFRLNTLVGYWAFDEGGGTTAADQSAFANNGTLINGPTWVDGRVVGKALSFDGANDYVSVGDPVSGALDFDATQSFSYGAWIKPAVLDTTGRRFISKRNSADAGYEFMVIARPGYGLVAELGDGTLAPSTYDAGIKLPLNVGQWYQVMTVVDRSASEMRLYLDGYLRGTVSISNLASLEISEPLEFGRPSGTSAKLFSGIIDEVRMYSRVLTDSEIRALAEVPEFLPPTVSGGQIQLKWLRTGQLEWAPAVGGPWTAITPAPTSPYSESLVPGENRFYRLVRP